MGRPRRSRGRAALGVASTSLNFDLSIFEIFVRGDGHRVVVVENALALLEQDVDVSLINTVPRPRRSGRASRHQ